MSELVRPQATAPRHSQAIRGGSLEVLLVACAVVAGLALRGWQLGDMGLSHFDEGVYAFSGHGLADPSQPRRLFPDQARFSPPVYVSLVALLNVLGVSPERSPFLVNLGVGTLTIPVVWWLTRRWCGPAAAVAAAWLVSLSEFHILMSRTALTDVTFALVFLLALGAVLVTFERQTRGAAVVAGLLTGLAWNTKYHGWFALVIAAMVIAARWRFERIRREELRRLVQLWAIMSVSAAACYLPWAIFIQSQASGSAGWAAYFATMLRLDWFGSLWRQVQQQAYLEGPWSRASVPLAATAALLVAKGQGKTFPSWFLPVSGLAALLVGSAGAALGLAVAALSRAWRRGPTGAEWLLASLLGLWFVMGPIYHPYFRLLLPFTLATFVLGGAALSAFMQSGSPPAGSGFPVVGAALSVAVWFASLPRNDPSDPWRTSRGLQDAAAGIDARLPAGAPVSVLGEPALAFYLHRRGHASFERTTMDGLDSLVAPRYLVAGVYLRRAPILRERFEARRDRLELLARFPAGRPSDLRLLDDFKPDTAARWMARPDTTYDLLLFRFTPGRTP